MCAYILCTRTLGGRLFITDYTRMLANTSIYVRLKFTATAADLMDGDDIVTTKYESAIIVITRFRLPRACSVNDYAITYLLLLPVWK